MRIGEDVISDDASDASELEALRRALVLATGFKLLFIRYRGEERRLQLLTAVRSALTGKKILNITLDFSVIHLLDILRDELTREQAEVVFVSGFERALPDTETAADSVLVANLNAARDLFPVVVSCPLVLWVPQYVLNAIARGAPDFFSVRSGAYLFADKADELVELAKHLTTLEAEERYLDANADALRQQFLDYLNHAQLDRDREKEALLVGRLGLMLHAQRRWPAAIECCSSALKIYGNAAPMHWLAQMHLAIADSRRRLGSLTEAQKEYEHLVTAAHQLGDRLLEAQALSGVGDVLSLQGNRSGGLRAYSEAIQLIGDLDPKLLRKVAMRLAETAGGPPASILLIGSNPEDTSPLRLEEEFRAIQDMLDRGRARVTLYSGVGRGIDEILDMLFRWKPDLVHFSGHGSPNGDLILEDSKKRSSVRRLKEITQLFRSLKHRPRCLMLNYSYSSLAAEAALHDVDCIVAAIESITDASAIAFCRGFYAALAAGESVHTAIDLGHAQLTLETGANFDLVYRAFVRPGVMTENLILIPRDEFS